jgi:hypothetical protein
MDAWKEEKTDESLVQYSNLTMMMMRPSLKNRHTRKSLAFDTPKSKRHNGNEVPRQK